MSRYRRDKEIEQYRTLLEEPDEFKDGFGGNTIAGLLFCGFVMIPGSIYLGLMTGGDMDTAASWVTVILFMEIARRALQPLSKQQLVILLHAAQVMMVGNLFFPGGPMAQLVYRAYLVGSDAVRDAGMLGAFPTWFAPPYDSPAITERNLFHTDWIVPIGIILFMFTINMLKKYTLGYFFFRLTSDVERLPFPRAPIAAQGAMALAEADDHLKTDDKPGKRRLKKADRKKKSERWRLFSLGAYIGLFFGFLQVGIPAITSLFLSKPVFLIPQPFVDTTTLTQGILPATPTGITVDIGLLLIGMVLPFWAIMGTAGAVVLTLILNPSLYSFGVLNTWQPGMDTVNTTFANNIDFWLSFNIGAGFGIAAISIFATARDLTGKARELKAERAAGNIRPNIWDLPKEGRGDYPIWLAIVAYCVIALMIIGLCLVLLPINFSLVFFLFFFSFVYNPLISYVSARLLGISGQRLDIPYIKQAAFLLSGQQGIDIWLAPIPVENFSQQAQSFRVNELTGVSFRSLIKTDLVAVPILIVLSLAFWAFVWKSDPIPSELFPAAQVNWELQAKNSVLIFSSTFGDQRWEDTQFARAIHPETIGASFFGIVILYAGMSAFGLPVMFVYGMMRGFGQFPHVRILEVAGALIGRYYLQKRFGNKNFLRMAPTILAGYLTGVGLIGMGTIALKLISEAVSGTPF